MSEKVSIVVPVYNAADKLEKCLNSLIKQSYNNIEIIIVDDGSNDNSIEICKKYKNIDNRIILISKTNGGVSSARNMGIKNSTGKYVMFADADDYMEHTTCEIMVNEIEKTNADMAIASFYSIRENNKEKKHICKYRVCNSVKDLEDDFEYIYRECFLNSPWNKLYKKALITKYYRNDMKYFEDYYFNLDYMDNINSFVMLDTPLYHYATNNEGSLTKVYREDLFDVFPKIYIRQIEFFNKYFGNKFDILFKESLLYGLYNSVQKLVYGLNDKKYKIDIIKKWINCDIMNGLLCKSEQKLIYKMNQLQYKIGYKMILDKKPGHLYCFFIIKKYLDYFHKRFLKFGKITRTSDK